MSDEYNDEHSGKGGSYLGGADGKRVPQAATGSPAIAAVLPDKPAKVKPLKPTEKGASNA